MAEPAPPAEKRSLFETVVTSTPVLLTVVATFILGRSSAEMTQAQYQRAVASQNQSKVGDQWAFFQAKRIRGTTYEATAVSLVAQKADPFTADTLVDSGLSLQREIQLATNEIPELSNPLAALAKKAEASLADIKAVLNPLSEGRKRKRDVLTPNDIKAALAALEAYPEPKIQASQGDDEIDAEQRKLLDEILDDVRKFKPEKDVAPKTLALKPETIDKAMEKAKAKAAQVAKHGKDIDRALSEFDALVERQVAIGREVQRLLGSRLSALANSGKDADLEIAKLERRLDRVRNLSARLVGDYKAARFAFDARRYETDARSNQDAAYLYDVQVLVSSARSDRHLKRSFGFMIAMLVAQVGVTVASLAMMLKYRLPVWGLAALAGVIAIAFGVCVYLEMAPLL